MSRKAPWTPTQSYTRSTGNRLLPYQRDNLTAAITRARDEDRWSDSTVNSLAARYNVHRDTVYRYARKAGGDD
jgi:hypothetical protein